MTLITSAKIAGKLQHDIEQAICDHTDAINDLMKQHGTDELIGSIINQHLAAIEVLRKDLKELKG